MTTVQEIEAAVAQLPSAQLVIFRQWLVGYVAHLEAEYVEHAELSELSRQAEQEHTSWQQFAAHNLARAYGDDEPEYSAADLKTVNAGYAGR